MKKIMGRGLVVLSALAFIACAEDETKNNNKQQNTDNAGTLNEQVAKQSAGAAFSATQTVSTSGDGQSAAFQMLAVGSQAMALVTPQAGAGQQPQGIGTVELGADEGCECAETSCTFTDCGNAGFLLNGTIAWTDTSLDCDYTVTGSGTGGTVDYDVFCDLDFTETTLDGELSTDGAIESAGVSYTFSGEYDFDNVTFTSGQPSGGSMSVSASVSYNGQTYSAEDTITF